MGNKQSVPLHENFEAIPVCDLKCQKQKQLDGLESAMKAAEKTDPESYEKARIQYYTLKEGQGWLEQEKRKLAEKEIEPVLKGLDSKYQELKNKLREKHTTAEPIQTEDSLYMKHQLMKERDKVGVVQRLSQFGTSSVGMSSWLSTTLDVVIAVLCLFIGYSAFKRIRG